MPAQPVRPPASQFDNVQDAPRWGGYWGTGGRDLLIGTEAGEQITGEGGHDFLDAGGGDDRIYAGAGDDTVLAGAGNDSITGDDGNDWLEGGAGQDTIYAGEGDDTLSGGAGDGDVLSGGNGADTYVIRRGDGRDSIEGFYRADRDRLDLTDFASVLGDLDSFTKLKAAGRVTGTDQWGGDTIIRLTDTDQVTLRWVNPRDLTDDQFVFAAAPTNRAPTDILISATVIAENEAPGTVVGLLSAVDPDAADTVRFSLLDDAGGAFALGQDGRSLVAARSLDYEAGPTSYAVTVRATDAGGLTTDKVLTITVRNVDEAVTAAPDRYDAVEDTVLTVSAEQGVLANDRAPDGGRAAIAGTIATALGGTVELATDGSFTYTPKANANGKDSFHYTLTDADGSTATGEVTLDVAAVPDPIRLSDVAAGKGGFKIIGEAADDQAGWSVADAGDVNGDGVTDLLVGAPNNNAGEPYSGAAYVVFGKADTATVDLRAVAAGHGGFKILGENNENGVGISFAAAGDVNGDGLADFLVGGKQARTDERGAAGAAYLVYGKADGTAVNLDDVATGKGGVKILGENQGDLASWSLSAVGDTNGDGFADILIGAPRNEYGHEIAGPGAAYLVYGKAGATAVDLRDIAAGNGGYKIIGENSNDWAGRAVSAIGDVNQDGLADFLIGAFVNGAGGNGPGAAYVVFGKTGTASVDLKDVAAGEGGFKIIGENEMDRAGSSVSGVGDINGDGRGDFLISSLRNDEGGADAGAAYLVFGKAETEAVLLRDIAAGKGGFKIIGESEDDRAGRIVAGIGDINGDGLGDLMIAAPGNDAGGVDAGAAYLVYGKADTAAVHLSDVASGQGGIKIVGEAPNGGANMFVSAAGDINHDGIADVAIGFLTTSSTYVVFGSHNWPA